jgi:type III secretory pathway lipoprotein EscJ
MSSEEQKVETRAKTRLAELVRDIDQVVKTSIADMKSDEITFIMSNYSKHLKYDLTRDFEEARTKNLTESPFDAIINDNLGIND